MFCHVTWPFTTSISIINRSTRTRFNNNRIQNLIRPRGQQYTVYFSSYRRSTSVFPIRWLSTRTPSYVSTPVWLFFQIQYLIKKNIIILQNIIYFFLLYSRKNLYLNLAAGLGGHAQFLIGTDRVRLYNAARASRHIYTYRLTHINDVRLL